METTHSGKKQSLTLIYAAFIAGLCSIIYELLIATTISYFLGDSITYFSLTIGFYMAAMGLGSFVSKYIEENLLVKFISAELALGVLGGLSIPALYFSYATSSLFIPTYLFFTISIGFLIGLEIPFLTRLMETYNTLKVNIANILSFDYLGALIATISFPFVLLPFFGVYQSSLIFGLANMSIAIALLYMFSDEIKGAKKRLVSLTISFCAIIVVMIIFSGVSLRYWDQALYEDRIVHSEQSRYQHIVLTKNRSDIRLFLNGNLQFSAIDEYRYHESLVLVPMAVATQPIRRVLLLGAGDGLAVRELLKFVEIEEIVLVDLDKRIVELAKTNPYITEINKRSLENKKVSIIVGDAFSYLLNNEKSFDLIICDLPDPNNNALARLYSKQFYKLIQKSLAAQGIFVTQATSPYFAKEAFWSIAKTIEASGFKHHYPYHASIPSFGDWGFVLASHAELDLSDPKLAEDTRFLSKQNFSKLFVFDKDIITDKVSVNHLDKPVLLNYYLRGWRYYAH